MLELTGKIEGGILRKGDVASKVTGTDDNIQMELIDMLSSSIFKDSKS